MPFIAMCLLYSVTFGLIGIALYLAASYDP